MGRARTPDLIDGADAGPRIQETAHRQIRSCVVARWQSRPGLLRLPIVIVTGPGMVRPVPVPTDPSGRSVRCLRWLPARQRRDAEEPAGAGIDRGRLAVRTFAIEAAQFAGQSEPSSGGTALGCSAAAPPHQPISPTKNATGPTTSRQPVTALPAGDIHTRPRPGRHRPSPRRPPGRPTMDPGSIARPQRRYSRRTPPEVIRSFPHNDWRDLHAVSGGDSTLQTRSSTCQCGTE